MIFRFQKKTDLAISALRYLSSLEGRRSSGPDLARAIGTTTAFLPQVMAPLVNSGWVNSDRGPGGGYHLASVVESLSLLDVVASTEGTRDRRCILRDAPCPGDHECPVHAVASEARAVLIEGFSEIPLIPRGVAP